MKISIIAAVSENDVIGREGGMPWHLPDDLKHFKEKTLGNVVLMGRKTFESLGNRPLAGRTNIVLSKTITIKRTLPFDPISVYSFEDALAIATVNSEEELFVIGGGEIYKRTIPFADRMYLTKVHTVVEGDTFFPRWSSDDWKLESSYHHEEDDKHQYAFTIQEYKRR